MEREGILDFEKKSGFPTQAVFGIDEVGRGCIAGPVVACALSLPRNLDESLKNPEWISEIRDSKKLTPKKREELSPLICNFVECYAIGVSTEAEIDQYNILHATHLAMLRALGVAKKQAFQKGIPLPTETALVDGKFSPVMSRGKIPMEDQSLQNIRFVPIIKGDDLSLSIAMASIVAKVFRDNLMVELSTKFPNYGFDVHKGYLTKQHVGALSELGPCDIHRKSFAPIKTSL